MTDLQTLEAMFDRTKIKYESLTLSQSGEPTRSTLSVERGYSGFVTEFTFDADGMLSDMGAYE